ncbi:MAG: hypothetical protein R8M37_01345 [Alphaproteobacteria bacterium]|nr:hypothetical protein [Alphaproteobacteria bacterium]
MMLIETLFDLLSASAGAIIGAFVAFLLNRSRNKKMANQLVISRQALEKIKLENEELLKQVQDKENLILQMQVQILGKKAAAKKSKKN